MRILVSGQPIGRLSQAWRECVGTGRFELALRRDYQDSLAEVQREIGFHRLYEVTAHAVKDVDAGLLVGGPAISPGADDWLVRFAEFVTARSVPVDFISKHAYTSGPAQPVPFGVYQTLAPADNLLEQFASPRRLLSGTALGGLPVHITEFNSSYRPDNPIHDTAFHAAYLAPVLAAGGDHVDSFSYWTFCDVFEETGVPTTPLHGGFGLLTHRQIKKPGALPQRGRAGRAIADCR